MEHPQSIKPIPRLTKEVAHQAFPKGNLYRELGKPLDLSSLMLSSVS